MQHLSLKKVTFSDGLDRLMEDKKLSSRALAEKIDSNASTVSRLRRGESLPHSGFFVSLCREFPEVSIDALMFGDGGEPAYKKGQNRRRNVLEEPRVGYGKTYLPIVDAFASDSFDVEEAYSELLGGFDVQVMQDFPSEDEWYGQIGVRINGDSMNPHLHHGDIVLATRLRADDEFEDGKVYMVQARGIQPSAKRVQVHAQDRSLLELHSDSGMLPPRLVPKDDIVALYRITRTITDWGLR